MGGYVEDEFAMFGVELSERPARVNETVATLRQAWTGEPFEHRGRLVRVTPSPCQPGGPRLTLGGGSEAAARRAARIGDGFLPSDPGVWPHYRDECLRLGKPDPGEAPGHPRVVFLAHDVERMWEQIGPYLLHETNAYVAWNARSGVAIPFPEVPDVDALRATGRFRVLTPVEHVAELRDGGGSTHLRPMAGGIPPDVGWEMLRLFEHEVLPLLVPSPAG